MPSVTRTLNQPNGMTTFNSEISRLRNLIDVRERISGADIDDVRELYQIWRQHTHGYYDLVYSAYANTNPRGSEAHNRTSSAPIGVVSDSTPIVGDIAGYRTFSTQIFELINNFNTYVLEHYHQVQDESG